MKKVRTPEEQKALMERESAERMNRVAAAIEEKNDLQDDGYRIIEFPLRRSDGTLSGVSTEHGSRSIFQKK